MKTPRQDDNQIRKAEGDPAAQSSKKSASGDDGFPLPLLDDLGREVFAQELARQLDRLGIPASSITPPPRTDLRQSLSDDEPPSPRIDPYAHYINVLKNTASLTAPEQYHLGRKVEEGRQQLRAALLEPPMSPERLEAILSHSESDLKIESRYTSRKRITSDLLGKAAEIIKSAMGTSKRPGSGAINAILTPEEVLHVYQRILNADKAIRQAKEALVISNLKLVVSIARRYTSSGLPLLDLIQEGNLGLMDAVDHFKFYRGLRFSSYAVWWIRRAIHQAIANQSRTVRIPMNQVREIKKTLRIIQELTQRLKRRPQISEIAAHARIRLERVEEILILIQNPLSLQAPIDETGSELGDYLEDRSTISPLSYVEEEQFKELMGRALNSLTPRDELVIRMRYGIGMEREYTLEEAAERLSLTRERIRQIECRALNKLKRDLRG